MNSRFMRLSISKNSVSLLGCRLKDWGIEIRFCAKKREFLLYTTSRPTEMHSQTSIEYTADAPFRGIKCPGLEADQSLPSMKCSCKSYMGPYFLKRPLLLYGMKLKFRTRKALSL